MRSSIFLTITVITVTMSDLASAVVPESRLDLLLPNKICQGQLVGTTVCWPYNIHKFVLCRRDEYGRDYGTQEWCDDWEDVYDYGRRLCVNRDKYAMTCENMQCPISVPFDTMSDIVGNVSEPGSWTYEIPSNKGSSITVFNPIPGACQLGMRMVIGSRGFPPRSLREDQKNRVIKVDWDHLITNEYSIYGSLPEYNGYYGDRVEFTWKAGHLLAYWDNREIQKSTNRPLVVPYPPQPIYTCPRFSTIAADGTHMPTIGEEVLTNHTPEGTFNYTITEPGMMFFADAAPGGCRLGLIFRVIATLPALDDRPKTYSIAWELTTFDNQQNLVLHVGDTLFFHWQQLSPGLGVPSPSRGVSKLDPAVVDNFLFSNGGFDR